MTITQGNKGRIEDALDLSVGGRYRLNDIFSTAWLSHALSALAKNCVPDCIADEPMGFEEIADKTSLHAPSLYRALRAAAANGIFVEHPGKKFSHNAVSELLKTNHPYSWKGMACMWNHPSCLQGWSVFSECLKDGRSGIQHAFGKTLYEHLEETPGGTLAFSDAMISNSAHPSWSIANQFKFEKYNQVMDLGGGIGTLLCAVLRAHHHLQGIIYEIKELKQPAENYIQSAGLSDRAHVECGDFLQTVPSGPDLFMVKNSLWNWSDEQCGKIIANTRAAAQKTSAQFLLIEYVIDEQNASWTTLYDLQILNMPGGRARTLSQYESLLQANGFAIEQVQIVEDETLILSTPV
ncbi:MAG TPA: methyltransferase [Planktothrix sp.]|jgi:hypothetical protein